MQDDMLIFIQSMIATVAENKRKEKKKIPLTAVRVYTKYQTNPSRMPTLSSTHVFLQPHRANSKDTTPYVV
ncbi:hypothetical protein HBH56_101680 [Parastagonospora nodorum]|uniref:Uncharacterized protein n=1 Tax=Phaeosphaeria nodorum (strain SN15 / ATCC MYA-4574 / FGSC 10173) TaxID=321614 RepID=A0A7U2I793_PHANO|nr:hypothetical protein HBH56_101680 [Parastagonospora nodorum]QRD04459.1 hypothetical protein JI435_421180 [Parastagonospora nodorum SN15]KAH3929471.1 hypothetical protein HBH54_128750 [Parastagonospora nodorum]KAH3951753.1 hypothetical protein HBH53_062740 [Parastagonospora nodorum]KAH3975568.1 hypothetical protein HBH52_124110 [Parastagonospora nodorum]